MGTSGDGGTGPTWGANEDGISALPLRLVSPVDWSYDPSFDEGRGAIRIHLDRLDRDTWYKPHVRPVLEGLDEGLDLPAIARRLHEQQPEWSLGTAARLARRIVGGLASQGNVEIVLPPVPERFGERFERVRELGRGGVGVAWLCRDLDRGETPVVVKHAWNWTGPLAQRDQALREEAALLEGLDHPSIIHLVETLEVDGRFHMVREYVEGEELSDVVLGQGAPAPAERARIARQVAGALDHLHEHGVLCLDVKPSNFMLTDGGRRLVLTDLSHGRRMTRGRVELEGPWGTQAFSAPEVHNDHVAGPRSDVYGLGCLYSFMVRELAPRGSESVADLLDLLSTAGATGPELALVEGCLQASPDERPSTPGDAVTLLG